MSVRWCRDHGVVLILLYLVVGCASGKTPDWVNGPKSVTYPDQQYMIGVGQGDTRGVAEERAYAALARIFKAEIISQSKDWESYVNVERKGASQTERKLTIETMTNISTDKMLQNVRIADTWKDSRTGVYSALAVLERATAAASLSHRISELDEAVGQDVTNSRQEIDKLLKLRQLHRGIRTLLTREAFNSDLRVISGRTLTAPFSVTDLNSELERFLTEHLHITVDVHGDQADSVRQAIVDTLIREGLSVTTGIALAVDPPDLVINGEIRIWPADLPDPKFRYVRWCADFIMLSTGSQRIVGTIARSGREGHLNYREAANRALFVLKQDISSALVKSFADQIYGDGVADLMSRAACPKPEGP
jgi:hypothetical protein